VGAVNILAWHGPEVGVISNEYLNRKSGSFDGIRVTSGTGP
jgi:hypothetical protein